MARAAPTVAEIFQTMEYGPAPEADARAREWLKAHEKGFGFFINGVWTKPAAKAESIESRNPANGETLGRIAVAGKADVDVAIAAAQAAFPAWAATPGHERARKLYALARLVQKHSRILAVLETLDNGKPIRETRDIDVPLVARHFSYHAGWAQLLERELPDYAPLGVCAQIIPWNFPLLMLAWKVAPALAAGNCVVLKPAEQTSLSALFFAEMAEEAGLPPGVFNLITGAGETGALLAGHPGAAKIAFTGSTDVGRKIREATAGQEKKLTLELGGKSPFIVFEDADLDGAVEGLIDGIFFNQGQVCCAGSRLLVEEGVSARLIEKLKTRLSHFRVGDPLDKAVDMGAIVDETQLMRIDRLVSQGAAEGAQVWQPDIACPAKGCFYPPTLLTDISPANTAAVEEIFGPVLAIMTFRKREEAIQLANNTRYGLSATIWSENINRAHNVASELKAGTVWINMTNQFDAACGFGGYRESGFGREGGLEGFLDYLKLKDEFADGAVDAPAAKPASAKPPGPIDRTPKLYIGGKQTRPDNGASLPVFTHDGRFAGAVGDGSRKDVRDAVEAAFAAQAGWAKATAYNRAQVLYFIAENLSARAGEFEKRLADLTGATAKESVREVEASIARLFTYAAWADKYDGAVHSPPIKGLALTLNEPMGIIAIACPDPHPLLALVSLVAPAVAMGNAAVVVPSERYPLLATDFYQVLDTSDVPGGVVNVVTGARDVLIEELARHDQVDALWANASAESCARIAAASTGNLKRLWLNHGRARDWFSPTRGEGRHFLREATQVKNIWVSYAD